MNKNERNGRKKKCSTTRQHNFYLFFRVTNGNHNYEEVEKKRKIRNLHFTNDERKKLHQIFNKREREREEKKTQ